MGSSDDRLVIINNIIQLPQCVHLIRNFHIVWQCVCAIKHLRLFYFNLLKKKCETYLQQVFQLGGIGGEQGNVQHTWDLTWKANQKKIISSDHL